MAEDNIQLPNAQQSPNGRLNILFGTMVVWLLLGTLFPIVFYQAPAPLPPDAPDDQFSAMRADKILELLVGDGIPHYAGSAQNDIVRERIVELVRSYGYEPQVQETEHRRYRSKDGDVFPIENILFRLKGKSEGKAVMLVSHYDSVPQGPGAADDGVGTSALLEVARMLKNEGPFERDIIFLITDGEEFGLLGADKFVQEHPWADEVECCINVEARGSEGPSFMFETSENTRWLVPLLAKTARRPMTSSLYYEVYKQLPNDTDFTIFKAAGYQGYNFAFIRNVNFYHTPDDNFENASRRSMQHHGEQMLGLIRELGDLDFAAQPQGTAVYFDVCGRAIVWWPSNWSIWMGVLAVFIISVCGWVAGSLGQAESTSIGSRLVGLFSSMAIVAGILCAMAGIGFGIHYGLRLDGVFDTPWPQQPMIFVLLFSFFAAPLLIAALCTLFAHRWLQPGNVWLAIWLMWGVLAIVVSSYLNGASYLFIVPALAAALSSISMLIGRHSSVFASCCSMIGAGFIWLPLTTQFYDAFGFNMNIVYIVVATIVGSSSLPMLATLDKRHLTKCSIVLGSLVLIAMAMALVITRFG